MPAEPRRRQKVFTEEELKDIEQKRLRGELSCAECRRLKLKCDKKVPCGSCCRRGCESICPCGILSAGQGTRFVLADTDHLHRKITEMSTRIRQLEDALAILQASVSSDRHPLLNDDLLRVKFGAEAAKQQQEEPLVPLESQAIDALGTLTLTDAGDMRYFGRSAGSETLIAGEEWEELSDLDEHAETSGIPDYTVSFPFSSHPVPIPDLVQHLPSQERAQLLSQSYIDHASLFFRPIKGDELFNSFLPKVYDDPTSLASESLAMLFFILALGALFDLTLSPYNKEAELYYRLGTSALSIRPTLDMPQIDTVRAVGLLATYHSMASKKCSRDSAWCSMSLAAKLAQSIGLHRDSARWNMDPTTVQIRRTLWWEVFSSDVSHSLALGRPPSIHQSFADCEFPTDEEATLSDSGEIEYGFWRMKYTFARDIFSAVLDATVTAKSPSYTTVLDLDKKVRQMSFPSSVKPYVKLEDSEEDYYSSAKSLRDFYASQHRTVTMLYLHRSFFAQSILDHPSNPLLSPFAPSFLTAFRSASILIKAAAHQFDRCANMAMRVWFLLYHIFSSAVIVGCVVTRSPNSNIAPGALLDLELAIKIFEHSSAQSGRAKIALGVLRKLRDKAVRSYSQSRGKSIPREPDSSDQQSSGGSPLSAQQDDDSEDELAIFGGQTKVLTKSHRSKHRPQCANSPGSMSSDCSTSPPPSKTVELSPIHVHPSLMDYLKDGGGRNAAPAPEAGPSSYPDQWQSSTRQVPTASQPEPDYMDVIPSADHPHGYVWNGLFDVRADAAHQGHTQWLSSAPYQSQNSNSFPAQSANPFPSLEQMTNWPPPGYPTATAAAAVLQYGNGGLEFGGGDIGMGPPNVHPGAMVELGLMTESNMDLGWVSFMRECGIFGVDVNGVLQSPQGGPSNSSVL